MDEKQDIGRDNLNAIEKIPVLSYGQMKILKEQRDKAVKEQYEEKCRIRLANILSKKIETAFIGAISSFEKHFGFLWGINLRDEDRTEEQKRFFELWQATRSEILTNGNNQIRGAKTELSQYTVVWNRYHTEFRVTDIGQPICTINTNEEPNHE